MLALSPSSSSSSPARNLLLAALSQADRDRLQPHLQPLELELRKPLEQPNKRIDSVYFLDEGIASVVAVQAKETNVEIGLIGREGMTGLAIVLGDHRSPHATYIQAAGRGRRIAAAELRKALAASATLQTLLMKFVQAFMVQTAHTAIANARARLDQRLARWLLMAHDRMARDEFPLTQEFAAMMLGTSRQTVTIVAGTLQAAGLITYRRGTVTVLDRDNLESASCECYALVTALFEAVIADGSRRSS
jgi:CRP-like cAMP-binding protein